MFIAQLSPAVMAGLFYAGQGIKPQFRTVKGKNINKFQRKNLMRKKWE